MGWQDGFWVGWEVGTEEVGMGVGRGLACVMKRYDKFELLYQVKVKN